MDTRTSPDANPTEALKVNLQELRNKFHKQHFRVSNCLVIDPELRRGWRVLLIELRVLRFPPNINMAACFEGSVSELRILMYVRFGLAWVTDRTVGPGSQRLFVAVWTIWGTCQASGLQSERDSCAFAAWSRRNGNHDMANTTNNTHDPYSLDTSYERPAHQ